MAHLIEMHDGMTVIAIQKATPAMTFDAQLYFRVGAGYEPKHLAGISHFLEHSVFLGTKKFPERQAVERNLLSFGGTYNAATGVNATSYSLSGSLQTGSLERGVESLYDLCLQPRLNDDVEIKKERKVVVSELEQELTAAGEWADPVQVAYETMYKGTVLEQSVLGTKKTLKTMGGKQLQQYHKDHYHKESGCLTVVSPLPPEKVMRRIRALSIPGKCVKTVPTTRPVEERGRMEKVKCIEASTFTWDLDFFFSSPKPQEAREHVALKLMSLMLFHSELSSLFGEARKKGLVYMAFGMSMSYLDTHVYRVATTLAPAKAHKFFLLFKRQIRKLLTDGLDKTFLSFCKEHFLYSRQVMLERYELYASKLVEKEFLREGTFLPEDEINVLGKVTEDDILDVMREVFSAERRVVTLKGPELTDVVESGLNQEGAFLEPLCRR